MKEINVSQEKINNQYGQCTAVTKDEIFLLKTSSLKLSELSISKDNNNEIIISDPESGNLYIKKTFENDKFKKYEGTTNCKFELTDIYPANEKEIKKFLGYDKFSSIETWDDYNLNVKPIAEKQNITWIYNILEHKNEVDNILYEDNDIMFIYDYKVKKDDPSCFYALIFFKNERIYSIRDLESKHIDILENTRFKIENFMKEKFSIEKNKLRMYFHYPPSFWYLHIHVNLFDNYTPGINTEYCHMLSNVIQNLKLDSYYYKKINIEVLNKEFL